VSSAELLSKHHFLWILIVPPPKKRRLPQLSVFRPFRERHFAHQPWLNPLSFLWDFLGFATGDLSGRQLLVIRLPPTKQRTVRSEDDRNFST
jgi:hypothetical protein